MYAAMRIQILRAQTIVSENAGIWPRPVRTMVWKASVRAAAADSSRRGSLRNAARMPRGRAAPAWRLRARGCAGAR